MGDLELKRSGDFRQEIRRLDDRDVQLWSINLLIIVLVAGGFAALLLPPLVWNMGPVQFEGRFLPGLFFGFIVLIVLFNLYALDRRRALRSIREQAMREMVHREEAEQLSLVDPLTGLFNRRYMEQLLAKEIRRTIRLSSSLTFLMIDVDNFKSVNDRFGHPAGDRFLKEVAEVLKHNFRGSDTIFRYGGDEFLVVLADTNEAQAQRAVERLMDGVKRWNEAHSETGYDMALSCGAAGYEKGAEVSQILKLADSRMYQGKTNNHASASSPA